MSISARPGAKLAHLHIADSLNHRASSGLRYIVNPPGSTARVHLHLDIGQSEVNWPEFFGAVRDLRFEGIATVCVFAWEERARASSRFMLERVTAELGRPTIPTVASRDSVGVP
jgi:myo-inositol catabolism protein IolH